MLFDPKHEEHLGALDKQLRRARAITPELMSDVIAQACTRFAAHGAAVKVRVDRLIAAEAWSDAAIALIDVELPQWKLRRLVHEDGEWSCMLCRHWQLPDWLDDTVEAGHEV